MAFENLTQGMGTGAFSVLLLRLTQKRFSATQYALFSSLFGLPRLWSGPLSGFLVNAMGWKAFFWLTMVAGIPGLFLLHRFAPLGVREPTLAEMHSPSTARRGIVIDQAGFWRMPLKREDRLPPALHTTAMSLAHDASVGKLWHTLVAQHA
jgi:MFS family permease